MSETRFHWSISVLPTDPECVPNDAALAATLEALAGMSICTSLVPPPRPVAECHARQRFYGSEGFSCEATCPKCGHALKRETKMKGAVGQRWFAQTDELAAQGVDGDTPVTFPGCGHEVALATVAFEYATGAARCALVVSLPVWLNEWFDDDSPDVQDALPRLSDALGTPVRLVRRLLLVNPRDRRAIARLVSDDSAGRLEALRELDREREGDEDEWDPPTFYYQEIEEPLLAVMREDGRAEVRDRVLSMLVAGKCWSEAVRDAIADDLSRGGEAARTALHLSLHMPHELFASLLPQVRALAADPARLIRSNVAWVLSLQRVDSAQDRAVIRSLALDFGPQGTHDEAVVAMSRWIEVSGKPPREPDVQVLRDVAARFPQSRAGRLAAKLLG
jgi:hypothetical protein